MSVPTLDAGRPAPHACFMASKKVSGFVTEDQRKTERLTLRLDPETMGRLHSIAEEHGWTLAETVKQAFEAFERELDEQVEYGKYIEVDLRASATRKHKLFLG